MTGKPQDTGAARPTSCAADGASFYELVGGSSSMRLVYEQMRCLANSDIPVLILGETGTGKELAARALHRAGGPDRPFIVVNCPAIPRDLFESHLFGHERGAFTGATQRHVGLVARAHGGILFLDEIAELPHEAQAKLLRVIDSGEYQRVGGEKVERSQFRLLAATNQDLEARVERGFFRQDLLHRLGAMRIVMPPLREHREDIAALAEHFLQKLGDLNGSRRMPRLSPEALRLIESLPLPGNVRELSHLIEAAAATVQGTRIEVEDIAAIATRAGNSRKARGTEGDRQAPLSNVLGAAEAEALTDALQQSGGNRKEAAKLLGISRSTLYRKLDLLNGDGPETVSQI